DFHVTGVQTCALPISARAPGCWTLGGSNRSGRGHPTSISANQPPQPALDLDPVRAEDADLVSRIRRFERHGIALAPEPLQRHLRSEERRVGKAWRPMS